MTRTLTLSAIFCLFVGTALAAPPTPDAQSQSGAGPAAAAPIRLYQRYLSGADGHRCPMTPSCSSYALQAMERHGAFKGWIMTIDRLMRCGRDELTRSPSVITPNGVRCRDTVENNDFWWH